MQTLSPPPAPDRHREPGRREGASGIRRASIATTSTACAASRSRWSPMFHVWFGRVSGGVDVFLALSGFFFGGKILRAALNPAVIPVAGDRAGPAGPPAGTRAGRRAGRLRAADHPGPAADPLGDLRRPEPGQPRLLPELAAGQLRRRTTCGPAKPSARCSTSGRCRCRASSTSPSCCWSPAAPTCSGAGWAPSCAPCSWCC